MASNDLPVYPTPQQAAFGANGQQAQTRRTSNRPHAGQGGHPYNQQAQGSNLPDMPTTRTYMNSQASYQNYQHSGQQPAPTRQNHPNQTQTQPRPTQTQNLLNQNIHYQQQPQQQQPQPYRPQQQMNHLYQSTPLQYLPVQQQHQQQQQQHQPQPQHVQQQLHHQQQFYLASPPLAPQYQQYQAPVPQYQNNLLASVSQYSLSPPAQSPITQVTNRPPPPVDVPKKSNKQRLETELRATFDRVDTNRSGRISGRELSLALTNFDNTRFQESTVRLMIKLFTNESSSSLNYEQFVSLWKYLTAYKKLFVAADVNKLGDISFGEFQRIIEQIGYKLNVDLVLHLFQKFANKDYVAQEPVIISKLKFDSFIELLVYLRKLTDIFKQYDNDKSGVATINYLDFLYEISNLT